MFLLSVAPCCFEVLFTLLGKLTYARDELPYYLLRYV